MNILYKVLKGILYTMIGIIIAIFLLLIYSEYFSGYKKDFEFKEISTGKSVFLQFPYNSNIARIKVKIKGEISEDVDVSIGGSFNVIKLKRSANIDTTYESDYYSNQVEIRTICYKECKGNLKGTVRIY
ncbi:MAG: hypothetical protein V4585_03720 [Bacteroidota bacterium]